MVISAGVIYDGKPVLDSIYLKMEHEKKWKELEIRLAPDEAQAIIWVLSGAVWSWLSSAVGRRRMRQLSTETKQRES